jgi:hypothetical protein
VQLRAGAHAERASQGIQAVDVIVERRQPHPELGGHAGEGQRGVAIVVGEDGRRLDDAGGGQAGSGHGLVL